MMPALVGWENVAKTIIRQELIGDWSLEEYIASAKQTQFLTGSRPHTVHVIIDFTQSRSTPERVLDATPALNHNLPANQGLLILVRCPESIRPTLALAKLFYPRLTQNIHHVESLAAGLATIYRHASASDVQQASS